MEEELYRPSHQLSSVELAKSVSAFITYELGQHTSSAQKQRFFGAITKLLEVIFGVSDPSTGQYDNASGLLSINYVSRNYTTNSSSSNFNSNSNSNSNSSSKSPPLSHHDAMFALLSTVGFKPQESLFQLIRMQHPLKFSITVSWLPLRSQLLLSNNPKFTVVSR